VAATEKLVRWIFICWISSSSIFTAL
jgi:hypothetical protein